MSAERGTKRTCPNRHTYYKKSDCPTCPVCEKESAPKEGFLSSLSAPARRALQHEGIDSLARLSTYSEKDILKLHGIGPSSMPKLRQALAEEGLAFSI